MLNPTMCYSTTMATKATIAVPFVAMANVLTEATRGERP